LRRGLRILISFRVPAKITPVKPSSSKKGKSKAKSRPNKVILQYDDPVEEELPPVIVKSRKKMVVNDDIDLEKTTDPIKKGSSSKADPPRRGGSKRFPAARKAVHNDYIPPTVIGTTSEKEVVSQGKGDYYSARRRECTCVGAAKRWCSCNPVEEGYGRGTSWKVERERTRTITVKQRTRRSEAEFKLE